MTYIEAINNGNKKEGWYNSYKSYNKINQDLVLVDSQATNLK